MPSLFTRLTQLLPGYTPRALPAASPPARPASLGRLDPDRRLAIIEAAKKQLENSTARPRPSSEERVPSWYSATPDRWFLPYADSVTRDTPEIRAAMRLMRRDGYVKAASEPQILSVASEDWQVQPSEEGNPDSEEQAEFVKRGLEDALAGGVPQLVRSICAPLFSDGFSLAEPVWGVVERGRLEGTVCPLFVKARDPELMRIEGDAFGNLTTVTPLRDKDAEEFPVSDFLYARYMTVFDEPLGQAAFRAAYGPYWQRDTVRKLRIIHTEKKMAGFLVGTYQDADDKGPLEAALRAARSATWAAVPEGVRLEAIALSTASEPDYKSFDESLRDEVVTAIAFATLQILTGSAPGDIRGDSKVQKQMSDLGPWMLMSIVQDAVNTQLIPRWIDYNYAFPAAGGYPKLTFGAVSNAELLELVQLVQGAQAVGLTPSKKYYAKALSIQQADPNDPDDAMAAPGAGGPMGGMPPGMGGGFGTPGMPPGGGAAPFGEIKSVKGFEKLADILKGMTDEQRDGLFVMVNTDTGRVHIDVMDWGDGDAAEPLIKAAEKIAGKKNVEVVNEGGKPTGRGWKTVFAEPHTFAWQPARSRDGGPKAVGTGEDAGKRPLYDDEAVAALNGKQGGSAAGRTGADEPALRETARRAAGGDAQAAAAIRQHGHEAVGRYAGSLAKAPAVNPADIEAEIQKATKGLSPRKAAGMRELVTELATERTPEKLTGWIDKFAGWLGKLGVAAIGGVLKAVGRFAKGVGEALWKVGHPAAWYLGGLAVAAACVAAPALAVAYIPAASATLAGQLGVAAAIPAAVLGARESVRRGSKRAGEVVRDNFYPETRFSEYRGRVTAAEVAGVMVHRFGWDDWKPKGESMVSPGGRSLKRETWERLKGGSRPADVGGGIPLSSTGRPEPRPGAVYNVPVGSLNVDPARFQFKLNTNTAGVTDELKTVKTWNPDFAGVVAVWRDPADGKDYVVNGHHRHDLAGRLGVKELAARWVDAPDAKTARGKGALINIAEGRGTAVDAAKFMRDTGVTAADFAAHGVPLKSGALADQATALARLSDRLFDRLARGGIDQGQALAVARHVSDHARQEKLFGLLDAREAKGKPVPPRTVEEMARAMAAAPAVTRTENTLWGAEESTEDVFVQRAELAAFARAELAKEMTDFAVLASRRRAESTAGAGNVLNVDRNRELADAAERAKNLYDTLVNRKGPIADALSAGAVALAGAKASKEKLRARTETVAAVRAAIKLEFDRLG